MARPASTGGQNKVGDKDMTRDKQPKLESAGGHEQRYPLLGIVPKSGLGRFFLVWAAINIILALLPVFNIYGNSNELGISGMPTTVFYSYAVFTLNCILGTAYFLTRGLAWVELNETAETGGVE